MCVIRGKVGPTQAKVTRFFFWYFCIVQVAHLSRLVDVLVKNDEVEVVGGRLWGREYARLKCPDSAFLSGQARFVPEGWESTCNGKLKTFTGHVPGPSKLEKWSEDYTLWLPNRLGNTAPGACAWCAQPLFCCAFVFRALEDICDLNTGLNHWHPVFCPEFGSASNSFKILI